MSFNHSLCAPCIKYFLYMYIIYNYVYHSAAAITFHAHFAQKQIWETMSGQRTPHRLPVCSFLYVMLWTSRSICNLPHFPGGWQVERAFTGRCCHSHFAVVDGDHLFPLWNGRQEHPALFCLPQALSWLPAGLVEWFGFAGFSLNHSRTPFIVAGFSLVVPQS